MILERGEGGGQNPPLDDRNRALSIRTFGAISSKTTTKSVLRTKGRVFVFVVGLRSGFGALEEDLLLFFVRLFFWIFFVFFSSLFFSSFVICVDEIRYKKKMGKKNTRDANDDAYKPTDGEWQEMKDGTPQWVTTGSGRMYMYDSPPENKHEERSRNKWEKFFNKMDEKEERREKAEREKAEREKKMNRE